MKTVQNTKRQVVLIILDGWGYREDAKDNAIAAAKTPNFDRYWNEYPHTLLEASGLAVGLPEGQMGNSEVGHTTIGAGTIIDTDLVRIGKAIDSGEFASNPAFASLFDHVKKNDSTLHVMGLLSDGGVHSHKDHLFAFLHAAQKAGIARVALHIFADGRDTAPQSTAGYLKELETVLEGIKIDGKKIASIATLAGRFYAMDRDNNWDRLARAEEALFEGKGIASDMKASNYVQSLYAQGKVDEHLEPTVFTDASGQPMSGSTMQPHDGVFFFNFRADRARMLSKKLIEKTKDQDITFVTLTWYGNEIGNIHTIAFPQMSIETTLAKEISQAGFTQAHIAETEKYPHATYFLNGGVEKPYAGEKHIMLESHKDVPTHDLAPKMRAEAIADKAIGEINAGMDFIFINFANADMVGHTANVPAIIESVEEADVQFGRVVDALLARAKSEAEKGRQIEGIAFVTADHGNAETNIDPETGAKHTSHTLNLVPAFVTAHNIDGTKLSLRPHGGLADITPTILALFGIKKPEKMSGSSLIEN